MILQIIILLVLSIVSGILYRMGGSDDYNTKVRDLGVPTCGILLLSIFGNWNVNLLLSILIGFVTFGIMFASLTTYFKMGGQEDVLWWNWILVGLAMGLNVLPYVAQNGLWIPFGIRTIFLMAFIPLWCKYVTKDKWSERGRGFIITLTLGMLLKWS